jgi:hypothetical protein
VLDPNRTTSSSQISIGTTSGCRIPAQGEGVALHMWDPCGGRGVVIHLYGILARQENGAPLCGSDRGRGRWDRWRGQEESDATGGTDVQMGRWERQMESKP